MIVLSESEKLFVFAIGIGVIDIFLMLHLLILKVEVLFNRGKKRPTSIPAGFWFYLQYCAFCSGIVTGTSSRIPSGDVARYSSLFLQLCWIPAAVYAIVRNKLARGIGWGEYCLWLVKRILNPFLQMRYYIQRICFWLERVTGHPRYPCIMALSLSGVFLLIFFLCKVVGQKTCTGVAYGCLGVIAAYLAFCGFVRALSSCRSLLLAWMLLIFAAGINQFALSVPDVYRYFVWVMLMCLFWMLSGGMADYETAKMASLIINTITTIAVIVGNVFVGWFGRLPEFSFIPSIVWEQLQYELNLLILPFVLAGYLTALWKEIQVYWEKRHPEELPKDRKYISILEPVYLWGQRPKEEELAEAKETED